MRPAQTAILALGLSLFIPACNLFAFAAEPDPATLTDREYRFTLALPVGWTVVRKVKDPSSFLRMVLLSPDRRQSVEAYALKSAADIDLESLAASDRKFFPFLGAQRDTRTLRPWLAPRSIEKSYAPNQHGEYALARFFADRTVGYSLLAFSKQDDLAPAEPILDSFASDVSLSAHWRNRLAQSGLLGWLGSLLVSAAAVGVLYLAGRSGLALRRGLERRKLLARAKLEALRQGLTTNEKWLKLRKRSARRIALVLSIWAILYLALFLVLPLPQFLFSLLALIVPALGYFGVLFRLSDDPDDYIDL